MMEKIATETILLYSSYALLGILFLTIGMFLFSFTLRRKKREKSVDKDSKKMELSLTEEIDKMLFEYMVGKPHISESDKEHKINLYYALMEHGENIDKIYKRLSDITGTTDKYKEIEFKAAEIIKAIDESEGIHFVKDEVMPYLYVENDADRSLKIMALYEELSSMLCEMDLNQNTP